MGQIRLGVGLVAVQQISVVEGLLEGIAVLRDLRAATAALTADPDVRGILPMSLKNQELIPDRP